jgi:5-methylcytosine-specific restriction endonuclease McrA
MAQTHEGGLKRKATGWRPSEETRQKMREAGRNKRGGNAHRKGVKHTEEARRKISQRTRERTPRGPAAHNWKGGGSLQDDRNRPEYRDWRQAVFERDGFACQKCGDSQGGNLRAHHIQSFAEHPELRFEVSNGLTLCHDCHELVHFKPGSTRNLQKAKRGKLLHGKRNRD